MTGPIEPCARTSSLIRTLGCSPGPSCPRWTTLLAEHVGSRAGDAFRAELAAGAYAAEWGDEADLIRAHALCTRHRALRLGLVDGVVISVAERLQAEAIATLDLRHFGVVQIRGGPGCCRATSNRGRRPAASR